MGFFEPKTKPKEKMNIPQIIANRKTRKIFLDIEDSNLKYITELQFVSNAFSVTDSVEDATIIVTDNAEKKGNPKTQVLNMDKGFGAFHEIMVFLDKLTLEK
jgi:hypothetical protein